MSDAIARGDLAERQTFLHETNFHRGSRATLLSCEHRQRWWRQYGSEYIWVSQQHFHSCRGIKSAACWLMNSAMAFCHTNTWPNKVCLDYSVCVFVFVLEKYLHSREDTQYVSMSVCTYFYWTNHVFLLNHFALLNCLDCSTLVTQNWITKQFTSVFSRI